MAGAVRPSMQELIRRRRGGGFVGRRTEQSVYRDNFTTAPGDPGHRFLFHVHGAAGVGKTSLVRIFEQTAREQGALSAYVDEGAYGVLEAMAEISMQCAQQGHALKDFDKLLSRYRQQRHLADSAAGGGELPGPGSGPSPRPGEEAGGGATVVPAPASAASTALARTGLAAAELVPVIGPFVARAADPDQLAQGMDRWRAVLSTRLRSAEDVQLVMAPLRVLTPVFLRCMSEVADRVPWIALFFDTYERTGPLLDGWLREVMFGDRYGEMPANVVVTLAGQPQLDPSCWGDCVDLVTELPLEPFTETEARQLLAAKGITDERVIAVILELSGRLPVLVTMLAESRPASAVDVGDPSGTAVERFLKWITDPVRRAAALAGALPLELDEDVFRAVAAEESAGLYDWLRALPFVRDASGRCRYHDVVRTAMLRVQRHQSPQRWRELHTRLAGFHAERRAEAEEGLEPGEFWEDKEWRARRRTETYHLLCADPQRALPQALRDAVWCLDASASAAERWAEMLLLAGADAGGEQLRTWGPRLVEAWTEEGGDGARGGAGQASAEPGRDASRLRAFQQLLAHAPLDTESRALVHTLRGVARRDRGDLAGSLADLDCAAGLVPESSRPLSERGVTRLELDQLVEAAADFTQALSRLGESARPRDVAALLDDRGLVHVMAGRYEDAVADLSRSLELVPDDSWTLAVRGRCLEPLGRLDEALADLARALQLGPEHGWVVATLADVHRRLGNWEESVAGFSRVPDEDRQPWMLACRARAYQELGREEDALRDYAEALRLDPQEHEAAAWRAGLHRTRGRYGEALSDLTLALSIRPRDSAILEERGEVHRLLERFDEALADLDLALRLRPDSAFALGTRARVYRRLGRLEEAEAGLAAALALDPEAGWLLRESAEAMRQRALPEALAITEQDVALHPQDAAAHVQRALTLAAMERHEEAILGWDTAIGLEPGWAFAFARRAACRLALDHLEEARADCERALELDPENALAFRTAAQVHVRTDRLDEALTHWNALLSHEPEDADAWAGRARTLQLMRQPEPALADFDRAIELDGGYAGNFLERAWCHLLAGRHTRARKDVDRALALTGAAAAADANADGEADASEQEAQLIAALLETERSGPAQARSQWEALAARPAPTEGSADAAHLSTRLCIAAALADWPAVDALLTELTATEPYWLLRVYLLCDLRVLARAAPAGAGRARYDALVERLVTRWPDADLALGRAHNPYTSVD